MATNGAAGVRPMVPLEYRFIWWAEVSRDRNIPSKYAFEFPDLFFPPPSTLSIFFLPVSDNLIIVFFASTISLGETCTLPTVAEPDEVAGSSDEEDPALSPPFADELPPTFTI